VNADLHFLMIYRGRTSPACRGDSKGRKCMSKGWKALKKEGQDEQDDRDDHDDADN
jgi:hypothetical protein